jgi:hypothetical protein
MPVEHKTDNEPKVINIPPTYNKTKSNVSAPHLIMSIICEMNVNNPMVSNITPNKHPISAVALIVNIYTTS